MTGMPPGLSSRTGRLRPPGLSSRLRQTFIIVRKELRDAFRDRRALFSIFFGAIFLRIDYFALVDASTLEPQDSAQGDMRLIAAAVIGSTRLIDNLAI